MKILIIDNITKYIDKIPQLFNPEDQFTTVKFNELTTDLINNDYDLIILTGGKPIRLGLHEKEKMRFNDIQQQIILNTKTPIIGICYGFRMINEAFDSKLEYEPRIIKGTKSIRLISNFWKKLKESTIMCHEEHHFTCKRLGSDLVPLATSSRGIEIIKHKKKSIFALQFHPEVDTDNLYGDEVFKYILDSIRLGKTSTSIIKP
jgi:anthranilate/para-aminobenzoate synthase component II